MHRRSRTPKLAGRLHRTRLLVGSLFKGLTIGVR